MLVRLNKYLAGLGIASRRQVDKLIAEGRIVVNQKQASLGQKINSSRDKILVDGRPVEIANQQYQYIILNKPSGVLTTTRDDRGRRTVLDIVKSDLRLYPVGRLDYNSSGLIILTNDGSLANIITHPKYHLPKTYLVTTTSPVTQTHIRQLRSGLTINGQKLAKSDVSIVDTRNKITTLKISLYQGIKRQIRLMFAQLHLNLLTLHRVSIGPIDIGTLKTGCYRSLTKSEINQLKSALLYNSI